MSSRVTAVTTMTCRRTRGYRGIAKETLKAEVVTEVVPGKIVSTLREEISHIDLPVFREIPARPPDRIVTNVADAGAHQQQQQQAFAQPVKRPDPGCAA